MFTFFAIKQPLKSRSTKSKLYFHTSLCDIIVHIHSKYRTDRMKTGEAYAIWKKKVDGQTDAGGLGIG